MEQSVAAELLQECLKDIFAFSVSRVYNKQDAEDLTNEIICQVLLSVKNLKEESAFYGYMWKIAENTFKGYIRNKTVGQIEFNEQFVGTYWETPEIKAIETEETYILRRELSLLSKQYREVSVAYYIHNKSCCEIAEEFKISEEMVKYYLFKTRKILKEGFDMERKYGEKSYNPETFRIDFWGSGNNGHYYQLFERKLPGNIMLSAFDKPVSIQELSLELGVSAVYLEDEIEILKRYNLIVEKGNKYQTNIMIFKTAYELEFQKEVKSEAICSDTADYIQNRIEHFLPELKKWDFRNKSDNDNYFRWTFVNLVLMNALEESQKRVDKRFGKFPPLGYGCNGFVYGHDNDYNFYKFLGIYGYNDNRAGTAWFSALNYRIIGHCQLWQTQTIERVEALCNAILEKPVDENDEATVQLLQEGFVKINDGKLKATFPVFTHESMVELCKMLSPLSVKVTECMDEICKQASTILNKYTPEHLKDKCEQLCYIRHQAEAMAIIVEQLVEKGYLVVPEEKVNLCMYGVIR